MAYAMAVAECEEQESVRRSVTFLSLSQRELHGALGVWIVVCG